MENNAMKITINKRIGFDILKTKKDKVEINFKLSKEAEAFLTSLTESIKNLKENCPEIPELVKATELLKEDHQLLVEFTKIITFEQENTAKNS